MASEFIITEVINSDVLLIARGSSADSESTNVSVRRERNSLIFVRISHPSQEAGQSASVCVCLRPSASVCFCPWLRHCGKTCAPGLGAGMSNACKLTHHLFTIINNTHQHSSPQGRLADCAFDLALHHHLSHHFATMLAWLVSKHEVITGHYSES